MFVGSSYNPVNAEEIASSILPKVTYSLEETVKDTILNSVADVMARLLPKVPRPLDANNLRPISAIEPHPSRLRSLRTFLKREDADFTCPEQATLFELMCRGTESVLVILGTGKGKTFIIFLYAYMFGSCGVTRVVLPLSSLVTEFIRRAHELGVSASVCTHTSIHNADVQLMCVSIEHSTFPAFKEYVYLLFSSLIGYLRHFFFRRDLARLRNQKRLNIIVFDEIHKLLTDKDYRDVFNSFWVLNTVDTPIVGLSGSIPPSTIDELVRLTKTTWHIIRAPSVRPELSYKIISVPRQTTTTARIITDIPRYMQCYAPDDRLMVFCRSRGEVEEMSNALGIVGFTADTTDTNAGTMQLWRSGAQKVMVSTSILGCGFDYPSVRHVLHNGTAYTMIDQHQQESRAGRDGKRALAVTYTSGSSKSLQSKADSYGADELQKWSTTTQQCLRAIPSSYIDGVPTTCSLIPGCELCSYCEEQMLMAPPIRATSLCQLIRDPVVVQGPAKKATNAFGGPPLKVVVPPPKYHGIQPVVSTPISGGNRYISLGFRRTRF